MPIAESLLLEWEQDLSQWANVDAYPGANDSERIQNAMNSGKPVVYFPRARYVLTAPITIPPSVRHIDFMYTLPIREGSSRFIISEGSGAPLFIDHAVGRGVLEQAAPRPVVMRNLVMNYSYTSDQPSELYLESVAGIGSSPNFCPLGLTIWARNVNDENKTTSNFKVFGGTMWVLGFKTEGARSSYEVTEEGSLEVLGGFRNETTSDEGFPMVINDNSTVSFVGYSNLGEPYEFVVMETQDSTTRSLLESDVPRRPSRSIFVPLYVGKPKANNPDQGKTFSGTYKLTAKHSGRALAVDLNEQDSDNLSEGQRDGVNVLQYGTDNSDNRLWNIEPVANGYHKIISVHSGKALAINLDSMNNGGKGDATSNQVNVFQYGINDNNNRLWKIEEVHSGYYKLTNRHSGKVLDVRGVSQENGANVHQWEYVGWANQQWKLEPVSIETQLATHQGNSTTEAIFRIYPNPASKQLTVVGGENYQVSFYDLTGQLVMQPSQLKGVQQLDISHIPRGLYMVRLRSGAQQKVQRIVVE